MGANVQDSPDPLVRYVWDNPKATDPYQIFVMLPQKAEAMENEASFDAYESKEQVPSVWILAQNCLPG